MKTLRATNETDDREEFICRAMANDFPLHVIEEYFDWQDSRATQKGES